MWCNLQKVMANRVQHEQLKVQKKEEKERLKQEKKAEKERKAALKAANRRVSEGGSERTPEMCVDRSYFVIDRISNCSLGGNFVRKGFFLSQHPVHQKVKMNF